VYDLARDPAVNDFIERYRTARCLYDINEIGDLLMKELHDLGLDEDRAFLLRLEIIYMRGTQRKQQQSQRESKVLEWKR
jgi:hypothetical protein